MIIYINGFNSSHSQEDIEWLNSHFPNEKKLYPRFEYHKPDDLNNSISFYINDIKDYTKCNDGNIVIIAKDVGTIIGELLAKRLSVDGVILINPYIDPRLTLGKYLEQKYFINLREPATISRIHPDFINNLEELMIHDRTYLSGRVYLGINDDVIDCEKSMEYYQGEYHIEIFDGEHLVNLKEIQSMEECVKYYLNSITFV
jgi:predicted esterase YcpF (UPF0227 family)